jgi:hypothetical protein
MLASPLFILFRQASQGFLVLDSCLPPHLYTIAHTGLRINRLSICKSVGKHIKYNARKILSVVDPD